MMSRDSVNGDGWACLIATECEDGTVLEQGIDGYRRMGCIGIRVDKSKEEKGIGTWLLGKRAENRERESIYLTILSLSNFGPVKVH